MQTSSLTALKLNTGFDIPTVGLGTWTYDNTSAPDLVYHAIKSGYRHIDTARYYGNEVGVGKGVKRAISEGIVTRDTVFITSKIVPSGSAAADIERANRDLGLGYIDLVLLHWQGSNDIQSYAALENAVKKGIVRSIGISNFYTQHDVDRILKNATIMPAVIQNENHLFYQNTALQNYVRKYGTIIESYYPFGGRGHTAKLMQHETVTRLATLHHKTPSQIIIRWHVQAGFVPLPGSTNPKHVEENLNIFDFELSEEEMQSLAKMDKQRRFENW